ncbi:unnamed protein product [Clavelina lepadiformis]|uniref:Uncharacterized protein n=1 Tax=Clavelina lepadiformis TaxID=159417 RepID=A0ABP0FP75_CLALP
MIKLTAKTSFAVGSSLRCYQCNYSSKNGQNDCYGPSISSDYLQNCPNANDRYCLTTIINSQDSVIGNTITRGCSTTTAINGCGTTAGISSCLSTCNTDGCNNQNSVDMVDPDPGDKPLRCYQCSYSRLTSSHTSCKGPNVDEAFLSTCPSNQNYCITTKTSGDDDYINVVRGCASQASPSSCATVSGLQVCYSSCQADGCNGGDLIKSKINFVTIIAVITAAMIISQTI